MPSRQNTGRLEALPRFRGSARPDPESPGRKLWIRAFAIVAILTTYAYLAWRLNSTIDLSVWWIAVPLFLQTVLIFILGYGAARLLKLTYEDAAPSAMIGASNHFEVAIATATMLFGLSSGASLATVVGVLIEVPVMLMLVRICLKTTGWFGAVGKGG